MERSSPPADGQRADGDGLVSPAGASDRRRIVDLLPDSFVLDHSESEWLMTLLGADDLAYIFGDDVGGEGKN